MVARSRSGQEKQPRTHLIGTLPATIPSAALIVTVLLVAGCGRTTTPTSTSRPHATATPTSTLALLATAMPTSAILSGASLSWTAGKLPPTYPGTMGNMLGQNFGYGLVDPGDGNIAYACEPASSPSVGMAILATHDRARHWTSLTPIPSVGRQLDVCMITPDAADPSIVVVAVSWAPLQEFHGPPFQTFIPQFAQFVTFDGGAHWQPLHGPKPFVVLWLATYHGTTLAMLEYSSGSVRLWSSTDQMQTWHELAQVPSGLPFINPVTGDFLVVDNISNNGSNFNYQGHIDESTDLGQHWTSLPVPSDLSDTSLLVSPSVAGQPWRLCGIGGIVSDIPFSAGTLLCSMDSGRTWTSRPQLITTFDNTDKDLVVPEAAQPVAVGADGTIYAVMVSAAPQPMGIPAGLYQLTPQAILWQPLTLPPGAAVGTTSSPNTVDTTDIPGSGILWVLPDNLGPGSAGAFPAGSV